ncbi:MAG: glycosyltransferase family 2 protein, partial [Archangium sp.]
MSKQKSNSGSPSGVAQTSDQAGHLEVELLMRERRTHLEQLRQSEKENQSLRERASALEREREHLHRLLQSGEALLPLPGRQALTAARKVAGRFRNTLQSGSRNVKSAVRPLFSTLKRAEQKVRGPLDAALDHPAREQHVGTSLHVGGWATSATTRVTSVEVWLNEHRLGQAQLGIPRPDVRAARPWATQVDECGFAATFSINPDWIPSGEYTLRVLVRDDEGHEKELTRPVVLAAKTNDYPTMHPNYYRAWIARNEPDAAGLAAQRDEQAGFAHRPLISILTPVYNTPADVLREMIRSVREQTYPNWELCLVDGHSQQAHVREILHDAARDERIRIRLLTQNLGISGNTNEALAMARGEFIALLDHDDTLAPFALYEVVKRLNAEPETDVLYSDEDRVDADGTRHTFFFKPDWSPDLLQSFMYTGHLTVYRRSLVEELGGFRSEFDLSQDYDLALRLTERTEAIAHIPKVLYHWRTLQGSAAVGDKPHARIT